MKRERREGDDGMREREEGGGEVEIQMHTSL